MRQIQAIGGHFGPFVDAVTEVMQDDNSLSKILILFVIRLLVIAAGLAIVLVVARIFQKIVGKEIIQEEEIVIVHEYATEKEAAKARAEQAQMDKKNQ